MNILVGGLFSAICYRWPFIGLVLLAAAAGFVYCHTEQSTGDQICLVQDWSPTVTKDIPALMSRPENTIFPVAGRQPAPISQKVLTGGLRQKQGVSS